MEDEDPLWLNSPFKRRLLRISFYVLFIAFGIAFARVATYCRHVGVAD